MSKWNDDLGNFETHFIKEFGCWNWLACKDKDGYGVGRYKRRKIAAHRVSWLLYNGKIPDGLYVLHKCNNSSCVNPGHLYLGTQKDNIKDQIDSGTNIAINKICAKLDQIKVIEIRKSPLNYRELAGLFNVSRHCIWDILHYRSWKNVS